VRGCGCVWWLRWLSFFLTRRQATRRRLQFSRALRRPSLQCPRFRNSRARRPIRRRFQWSQLRRRPKYPTKRRTSRKQDETAPGRGASSEVGKTHETSPKTKPAVRSRFEHDPKMLDQARENREEGDYGRRPEAVSQCVGLRVTKRRVPARAWSGLSPP